MDEMQKAREIMRPIPRSCPVCGNARIQIDEVVAEVSLQLSECSRCEHRWTGAGTRHLARAVTAPAPPGLASAA